MPLFEFRCQECSQESEILVRGQEQPVCPHCGAKKLEKLFSTTNGKVSSSLPIASSCPPPDAPPCGPSCCRL